MIEIGILDAEGLRMSRGRFVLGPVDIHLSEGQCLILSGPNGSGKSTLLGGLCGYLPLMPGNRLDMLGETFCTGEKHSVHRLAPSHLGVHIQGSSLFDEITVKEHFRFFADIYGTDPAEYAELASSSPALYNNLDKRYGALSEGMRQVLHFVLAMGHGPRLLLLDEPTSGLDDRNQTWMHERLKDFLSKRGGIIMATHRSRDADVLGSSLLVLRRGKPVLQTSIKDYRNVVGYTSRLTVSPPRNMSMKEAMSLLVAIDGTVDAKICPENTLTVLSTLDSGACSRRVLGLGKEWLVHESGDAGFGDAFDMYKEGDVQ